MPPVVVSVINMKGGVGKSTITNLLGIHALRKGLNVLAVDLDPQANLSQSFMRGGYRQFLADKSPSIVEVFQGYSPPSGTVGVPQPVEPKDVAIRYFPITPGSFRLTESWWNPTTGKLRPFSPNLRLIPSRFDFSDNLTRSIRPDPGVLARFLSNDEFSGCDLVLIDCAPTESVLTMAAYAASRYILVPVKPEFFATIGFPLLQESIANYRRSNLGQDIEVLGVVINNATYDGGNDGGPEKQQALDEIYEEAERNDWLVFDNEIPHSRGFPKMMRGNFSHLGNAYDFRDFAGEFFESLGF